MPQPYVTGPAHVYAGIGQSFPVGGTPPGQGNTPVYVGTFKAAPKILFSRFFTPVMNDLSGDQDGYDESYQGKNGFIGGALTVYNWPVVEAMMTQPNSFIGGEEDADGEDAEDAMGTLMIAEGYAYNLWVHFPYSKRGSNPASGKQAYSSMPAGYHFLACWLIGPEEINPGTKAAEINVQWKAKRVYDPTTGKFKLYDKKMTGIPARPPSSTNGI